MPWKTFKIDNQYCVFRINDDSERIGDSLGCHSTRELANRQVAALNISEEKEQEEKAHTGAITSFQDLDAIEEVQEKTDDMRRLTIQFAEMSENILFSDEIEDKATAIQALANEFSNRLQNAGNKERWQPLTNLVTGKIAKMRDKIQGKDESKSSTEFFIWKDTESDRWRWLSIYSNNYRDNDNPPEIISEASHKRFIERVENKEVAYPELWLWHVPGTRIGQTDWLSYDDKGFSLASGTFDEGRESIVKNLSEMDDLLVSHGMPKASVKRDSEDKTIIIEHITREISPLPNWAAANKLTAFTLLNKEGEYAMAIPENKKPFLKAAGLTDEEIEQIEAGVKEKADEAQEQELEQKEETPAVITDEADVIKGLLGLIPVITELQGVVKGLKEEVEQLKQTDEQKIAEKTVNTPSASLQSLIEETLGDGSIFSKATEVDGRTKLARSKPEQAETNADDGFFLNQWIRGGTQ
jgi:hypothetical protein